MAMQSMQLDPNAQAYTDDDIVGKVNTATANITRASSVGAAARPIVAGEVGSTELAADSAATNIDAGTANITRASSVDAAARPLGAGEVSNTELAAGVGKANLDAMADTVRGYVQTNPQSGEFPIIAIQRDATGKQDVDYDDVPI